MAKKAVNDDHPLMVLGEAIYDAREKANALSWRLSALSQAFGETGNDRIAHELADMASIAATLIEPIRVAEIESTHHALHESEVTMSNVMKGILTMIEKGEDTEAS